jgi:hypothetical protein
MPIFKLNVLAFHFNMAKMMHVAEQQLSFKDAS